MKPAKIEVQHRKTGRIGTLLGECDQHLGWYRVLWNGEIDFYRYEPEDLQVLDDQVSIQRL